jgi:sugar lactone lactonase YvrE
VIALALAVVLGAVVPSARPQPLVLQEPFDVVEAGKFVVITDRRANAVYRLDPRRRTWARVATVAEARELEPLDARTVLVTSRRRILRLDIHTGRRTQLARARDVVLGLARADDSSVYVSEGGTAVVRIDAAGARSVVVGGRDGIHGLLLDGSRLLAAEAYAGNVLAVDLADGRVDTLARGLGNPSFLVAGPGGALYVSEFSAGRISLLRADGTLRRVASVPQVGPLWASADGTLLAATLAGDIVRVQPRTGRVRSILG